MVSFLALFSCSRKITSAKVIKQTPEYYQVFISANSWIKESNLFYAAIDSNQVAMVCDKFKFKTKRAHLSTYYPGIITTNHNFLYKSIHGRNFYKSNVEEIKDSLVLVIRKKKELEKIPLRKFIDSLKNEKTPYYLLRDTSNYLGEQFIKIEYKNSSNILKVNYGITDSVINYFDSLYSNRKTRFVYYSQTGRTDHKVFITIPCNDEKEINNINSEIYTRIKGIKNIEIEKYTPIKYVIYYFEKIQK